MSDTGRSSVVQVPVLASSNRRELSACLSNRERSKFSSSSMATPLKMLSLC